MSKFIDNYVHTLYIDERLEAMLKGELVKFGRFGWWSEKENANIRNHKDANNNGISFRNILPIFDDPYFYEIYDIKHSDAG